jgi:hypothetical protein
MGAHAPHQSPAFRQQQQLLVRRLIPRYDKVNLENDLECREVQDHKVQKIQTLHVLPLERA